MPPSQRQPGTPLQVLSKSAALLSKKRADSTGRAGEDCTDDDYSAGSTKEALSPQALASPITDLGDNAEGEHEVTDVEMDNADSSWLGRPMDCREADSWAIDHIAYALREAGHEDTVSFMQLLDLSLLRVSHLHLGKR